MLEGANPAGLCLHADIRCVAAVGNVVVEENQEIRVKKQDEKIQGSSQKYQYIDINYKIK
jgi:hypothetical protein